MINAIMALLGLDSKGFNKGLDEAGKKAGKFANDTKGKLDKAEKSTSMLGKAFGSIKGLLPTLSVGLLTKKIFDTTVAARDANIALREMSKPGLSAQFSTLEQLEERVTAVGEAVKKSNEHLSGTKTVLGSLQNSFKWGAVSVGDAAQNFLGKSLNPLYKPVDTLKDAEKDNAKKKEDEEKAKDAVVEKRQLIVGERIRGAYNTEEGAAIDAANRKRKEALGGLSDETNQKRKAQLQEIINQEHELEVTAIKKKYDLMREELVLQTKLATMTGTEHQNTVNGLKAEIALLKQRRDLKNGAGASANSAEENEALDAQITQKGHALNEAQLAEEMKSPAQRREERQAERERQRKRRQAQARLDERSKRAEWLGEGESLRETLRPLPGSKGKLGGPNGLLPFQKVEASLGAPASTTASAASGCGGATLGDVVAAIQENTQATKAPPVNR